MIRRFSKKHKTVEYKIGEIVYLFNSESKSGKGKKYLVKFRLLKAVSSKRKVLSIKYSTRQMKANSWLIGFLLQILPVKQNPKIIQDGKEVIINRIR